MTSSAPLTLVQRLRLALGPGLLLAGAAIGVSHLVQATRAGATYGFALFWLLALAIITKYPFLEFGPRFAAATGHNMITGYRRMNRFAFAAYIFITVGTMFIIQAAVTIVTAGLAENLFGLGLNDATWTAILLVACIALLWLGRYPGLDLSMKIIISLLTLCTLIAVLMAFGAGTLERVRATEAPAYWNTAGIAFIIAFVGWMPIPLDASIWHSIWTSARARQTQYTPSVAESRFDFDVGYGAAAFIGVLFFLLGALIMFGTDETFAAGAVAFSAQIVALYSQTLGTWSAPLVSVAAFVAMFSTTLAVTDAYPRVLSEIAVEWAPPEQHETRRLQVYRVGLFVVPAVALVIVLFMSGRAFTLLIDFAAGLSFIAAPVLGWFNLHLITSDQVPRAARPSKPYLIFSWICLVLLILFAAVWVYWRFFSEAG